MVHIAPRYDPRIVAAVRALDDPAEPIAETCRRVGEIATLLGLPRPSYVHVRRLVRAERARQEAALRTSEALREVAAEAIGDLLAGKMVDPSYVADRVRDARGPGPA